MENSEISLENLPKAVAHLIREVAEIKDLIKNTYRQDTTEKRVPIDIDEVSRIIDKAKPTIYTLVRKRMIPCYKKGKKLYFFEDEVLDWISKGKKKTVEEIQSEAQADYKNRFNRK